MRGWLLCVAASFALFVPACGGNESPSSTVTASTTPPASPSPTPASATIVTQVDVAAQPDPVLWADESLWVGHYQSNKLERVDPSTGR